MLKSTLRVALSNSIMFFFLFKRRSLKIGVFLLSFSDRLSSNLSFRCHWNRCEEFYRKNWSNRTSSAYSDVSDQVFSRYYVGRLLNKITSVRKLVPTNRCRTWGSLNFHTIERSLGGVNSAHAPPEEGTRQECRNVGSVNCNFFGYIQ